MSNDAQPTKGAMVRVDDLEALLYGFENRDATALGSRPIERIREAIAPTDREASHDID